MHINNVEIFISKRKARARAEDPLCKIKINKKNEI